MFLSRFPLLPLRDELAEQGAVEARGEATADAASRAGASRVRTAKAKRTCPECGTRFVPKGRQGYCSGRCRGRAAMRRTRERRAEREDAAWREQTERLRQLHAAEGFGAPNGATREY
jgi:tRNA(Ile2) C34 agmatinyltransferase TiaS